MAGIKQPILDIVNQIKTIPFANNAGASPNLYSAIFNNQIERMKAGEEYNYSLPAAFVEAIPQKTGGEIGFGSWGYDVIFRIHAVMNQPDAGDGTLDQNLTIYDLRDALQESLVHFQPTGCSLMQCDDERFDTDHDSVCVYQFDLITHFIETSGSKYPTEQSTPPTNLVINSGFALIEILHVSYTGGDLIMLFNLVDEPQNVVLNLDSNQWTFAAATGENTFTQSVSLSSGNYSITATGEVNDFTTPAFEFTI